MLESLPIDLQCCTHSSFYFQAGAIDWMSIVH